MLLERRGQAVASSEQRGRLQVTTAARSGDGGAAEPMESVTLASEAGALAQPSAARCGLLQSRSFGLA